MTEQSLSEDERRHIAEVLTDLAKQAMQRLGDHFQVQVKANFKAAPCWLRIQVQPYVAQPPQETTGQK